jgi:hypothetical protein
MPKICAIKLANIGHEMIYITEKLDRPLFAYIKQSKMSFHLS